MKTNKTARQVIDSLSSDQNAVVQRWGWPSDVPDSDQLYVRFITEAQVAPGGLTLENLNRAVGNYRVEAQEARVAWKAFMPTVPASLKGPDGNFTEDNLTAFYGVLEANFDRITPENLKSALRMATEERVLLFAQTKAPTGAKASNRTTISGRIDHSADADANATSNEVIAKWVKTLPASFLNKEGHFPAENFQRLMQVIEAELQGTITPKTLEVGLRLLKGRGQLVTFVEPLSPEAQAAAAAAKLYRQGVEAETDSIRHPGKDTQKIVAEAEAQARERVHALHKASGPKSQKVIESILVQHTKDKIPAPATLAECTAALAVEKMLDDSGSAGATHSQSAQVRSGLEEVVLHEMRHAANSGDAAIRSAMWTQIAYRCTEVLEKGYSTGPGSGIDANGWPEVRTNIVGGRSIR